MSVETKLIVQLLITQQVLLRKASAGWMMIKQFEIIKFERLLSVPPKLIGALQATSTQISAIILWYLTREKECEFK